MMQRRFPVGVTSVDDQCTCLELKLEFFTSMKQAERLWKPTVHAVLHRSFSRKKITWFVWVRWSSWSDNVQSYGVSAVDAPIKRGLKWKQNNKNKLYSMCLTKKIIWRRNWTRSLLIKLETIWRIDQLPVFYQGQNTGSSIEDVSCLRPLYDTENVALNHLKIYSP
jgi:hypothetical protein